MFASPAECESRNVPVDEWLAKLALDLRCNAVPVVDIVLTGRGNYGLDGDRLAEFVGRAIRRLLESGARTVRYESHGPYEYSVDDQYGETIDDVIANVVAAWMRTADPYLSGLNFATPEIYMLRRTG